MFSGIVQFTFIPFVWVLTTDAVPWTFFWINLGLHALFELLENSPCGIYVLRRCFLLAVGDTVMNSIGDLISFSLGYISTRFIWYNTNRSTLWLMVTFAIGALLSLIPYVVFYKSVSFLGPWLGSSTR